MLRGLADINDRIVQTLLLIAVVVNIFRTHSRSDESGVATKWSIPAGGLSVELNLHWGSPDRQESRRPQEVNTSQGP